MSRICLQRDPAQWYVATSYEHSEKIVDSHTESDLDDDDKAIFRQFSLKIKHNIPDDWRRDAPSVFTHESVPPIDETRARIAELANFKPRFYDCCVNLCIAYTGKYAKENTVSQAKL